LRPVIVPDLLFFLERLAAEAHSEGGWGYAPGQPAHLEPTCLAMSALSFEAERFAAALAQGREVLKRCAGSDGSYRLARGREEAVWPTALVLFVQATLDYAKTEIQRTGASLLALQGRIPDDPAAAEMHDINIKLRGWPWAENNFAWVEPTAWACLALRRAGYGNHPRVEEGLRLLLDRANDTGGINYGNRHVFGRLTEPIPGPTAITLLALQGRGDPARVVAAARYLIGTLRTDEDLEHLCWGKLALHCYRHLPEVAGFLPSLDDRIVAAHQTRTQTNWLRPSCLRDALTALALGTDRVNLFLLPEPENTAYELNAAHAGEAKRTKSRPWTHRLKGVFRSIGIEAAGRLRQIPVPSLVHIARVTDYNAGLAAILQRQYETYRAKVPLAGRRVVLKPNIVEYHRDKVINTHPHVIAAAIELCRREGAAEVVVAEGPGHCRNVEHLVTASGLGDVLRHYGVAFIDLNHDEPVKTLNLGRLTGLDYLYFSQTVATADVLISLAKLKTHHWAGATLSLKNLFGTLPGTCYGWPKNELHWRGLENSIVDIALTRTPDLAIVDGIIGMEGDGPLNGTPKPLGALIMGTDPLAVDATCCRLMKLEPEKVGYLILGYRKKLGLLREQEIQQIGESIDQLAQPFETLPHFHQLYVGRSA
jgi:uncharacterized protein (DUF362 family)